MSGPGILVWGGGSVRAARLRHAEGAALVAWPGADVGALEAAGLPFRRAEEVLGDAGRAAAADAGGRWARIWARLPLVEDRAFRDLVRWRGESLLWTAEGFLRTSTAGPRCAAIVDWCLALIDALRPAEIDASGLAPHDTTLLARAALSRAILFHGPPANASSLPLGADARRRGRWAELGRRIWAGNRQLPAALAQGAGGRPLLVVVLSRPEAEPALRPLLDSASTDLWMQPVVVTETALARFETPRVRRAAAQARRLLSEHLAVLRGSAALAASYTHRGVAFDDLAAGDLEALLLGRLPEAVRRLESAVEMLESARPALLLLGIERRDDRRTLALAAAAAGVPWAALQLGASEAEGAERDDGGPQPAATIALDPRQDVGTMLGPLRELARARVDAP